MNQVWQESLKISEIKYAELPKFGYDKLGVQVDIKGQFQVHLLNRRRNILMLGTACPPSFIVG